MKKVLITGSNGRIGKILVDGLKKDYNLVLADLPLIDVSNYSILKKKALGCDAIIHLAWNTNKDNCNATRIDPENTRMFENIYQVAKELSIPKIIMASSIHADDFRKKSKHLLNPSNTPGPKSPYGAHKVFMEELGKFYSSKKMQVVCVRFGAVGYGEPPTANEGKKVWLSKNDCVSLIKKILVKGSLSKNFEVVYGVSNNRDRLHDTINSFGWKPKEGC